MLNSLFQNPIYLLLSAVAILIAITVHEFSHAFTADKLGDPTPRLQGRVSLNPLVHLDLIGTVFLFIAGFGWGKPVQFDPYNLKSPRKDAAIISLAGPLSNFITALVLSLILRLFILFNLTNSDAIGLIFLSQLILLVIQINIVLGVFNLLPIYPLDGFNIVGGFLPREQAHEWQQLQRYGMIFLLLLVIPLGQSSMAGIIVRPIVTFILRLLVPM